MNRRKILTGIISVVGALLIAASAGLAVQWHTAERKAGETVGTIVKELRALMPEVSDGVFGDAVSDTMPAAELDGVNYVGLLEVPALERTLPVNGEWDGEDVTSCPRLFCGSVADGLVIGGSDNEGQLDFTKAISLGDDVYFTDVMGNRYKYKVSSVDTLADATKENLLMGDSDLTLFARNSFGFEYIAVRCTAK